MFVIVNNLKLKEIAAYIMGIILLLFIAAKVLGNENYVELIHALSYFHILISLLISFFLFFINGYIIAYLVKQQYQTSIKLIDMAMLPFMMHLFSYIIPFRGGLLFSALFLRMKYKIRYTEGVAIGVYTLFISLMITGLCGIYYAHYNNMLVSVWTCVSLLFLLSPVIVGLMEWILDGIVLEPFSVLNRIKTILITISCSSRELLLNYRTSVVMFILTLANMVVYIFFLFWITRVFNIHASIDKVVMFALMIRISTLVRIVPGNLGIQELFSGGAFYLLGGDLNDGLAIALFFRFIALVLTVSLGIIGIAANINYFKMREMKKIWSDLMQSEQSS